MGRPDPWRRFLSRVLPWHDQAADDTDRIETQKALAESRALRGKDRIRRAYEDYANGMKR